MTGLPGGVARPSITCPCCGAISYHPKDVEFLYCGRCYAFTGDPSLGAAHLAGECPNRAAPGPFADLAWLLDAGLEVRISTGLAGAAVTLFEGAGSVPVTDPVTVWPAVIVGAAFAMARMVAEDAGYAPGGIRP